MVAYQGTSESLLAELTDAAYASALRHQWKGSELASDFAGQQSFLELELEIWKSLRQVLERRLPALRTSELPVEESRSVGQSASHPARRLAAEVSRDLSETSLNLAEWQA